MKIREFIPNGKTPRPQQDDIFDNIEANWDKFRFFLIKAPTATGKSIVAYASARWASKTKAMPSAIVMHRKALQDQYYDEFPDLPMLKGMAAYKCSKDDKGRNCRQKKKSRGRICTENNTPSCTWFHQMKRCESSQVAVYNLHSYFHNEQYKSVLIADEAHNILPFLTELNSVKVKYSEYPFPDDIEDPKVATKYVEDLAKAVQEEINRLNAFSTADNVGETGDFMSGRKLNSNDDSEELEEKLKRYSYLAKKLKENSGLFIIKMSDGYQGKELTIAPKNLRDASEALWPSDKVSKVILLSATFNEIDMKTLGIDSSEVMTIEVDSPIPPENRPFVFVPVCNMSKSKRQETFPALVDAIRKITDKHRGESGIIHTTYELSKKLQNHFSDHRFIYHYQSDARDKLELFLRSDKGKILVACGMEEGLDLKDDLARFQIITSAMYPFLGDPLWFWKMKNSYEEYVWETVRKVIQQSGRISRHQTDFGVTYFLDENGKALLTEQNAHLWPKWFLKAARMFSSLDKALEKEWTTKPSSQP